MNNIDDYLKPRKDPTENQQILFLAEVNRKCPLCGNFLLKEKKDRVNKLYQIAHIYPNSPTQEEVKELPCPYGQGYYYILLVLFY